MSAVFDTSVVIDVLRQVPAAMEFLPTIGRRPFCTEVTRVEVIQGLRSAERRSAEDLFGKIEWVPVDEGIARRAGELGRRFRRSHPGIGVADLIVAATAEHLGVELATTNVRHFPMFGDLQPPYET